MLENAKHYKRNKASKSHRKILRDAFSDADRDWLAQELTKINKARKSKAVVSRNVIDQIAAGHQLVSAKRAKDIERVAGISKSILRPDLFD